MSSIQSISYAKLAEYEQTRIDLPIRKYVLIANLLRKQQQSNNKNQDMIKLEQNWFETCINELDNEEEQEEPPMPNSSVHHDLHLHAYYNFSNGNGFVLFSSTNNK